MKKLLLAVLGIIGLSTHVYALDTICPGGNCNGIDKVAIAGSSISASNPVDQFIITAGGGVFQVNKTSVQLNGSAITGGSVSNPLSGALEANGYAINNSSSISLSGTSGSSISTTNDQLIISAGGGVFQINQTSVQLNGAAITGGSGASLSSTNTWTAHQIINMGAGSLNPLITIATGTQTLFEITGSSFNVTMASVSVTAGNFSVNSGSISFVGSPNATGYRWRGPTTTSGRVTNDGTNVTMGSDDTIPVAIRSNSFNLAIFTGVSPSHIELNSNVGIQTTNPSSRLDLFNGSATIRGTGGNIGLTVTGGSITVNGAAGQGLSNPIFSVSTGTVRLFAVYASSINAGVPINASVAGASWGWNMAKNMSIDEFRSFIGNNGHLPTVPSDEKLNGGLTDLGGFMSKLLATNEMLAHYIGELEDRIKRLEGR